MATNVAGRAQRPSPTKLFVCATLLVSIVGVAPVQGQCPPPDSIEATMRAIDLSAAYRTEVLDQSPPWSLYRKAAKHPGRVAVEREGNLGQAVLVSELPIEDLWMAVNDEDHYAEGGYLPVEYSQVVDGTSRGQQRLLFQFFKRAGVGRWWIDEVVMNQELFETSGGRLWELRWWDLMETHAESGLPDEYANMGLEPIEESRGAWLLIPVADSCTLIEYVTVSDPGGLLGLAHLLGSGLVIRETLEGTERLAREHILEPHPDEQFVRPDGTPIGEAP